MAVLSMLKMNSATSPVLLKCVKGARTILLPPSAQIHPSSEITIPNVDAVVVIVFTNEVAGLMDGPCVSLSQPGCGVGLLVPHACPASKILRDPRISIRQLYRVFRTQAASFIIPIDPLTAPIIENAGIARRWRLVDTHKVAIKHCYTQFV